MIELKSGMILELEETWGTLFEVKKVIDKVYIENIDNNKVTFKSEYIGGSLTVPIDSFWKGNKLIKVIRE